MALSRLHEHWREEHFHTFLVESVGKPFEWGTQDCCLYAADAILAYTGVDIAEEFRNKYTTQIGALRTIVEITGGSTVANAAAYCAQKHGLEEHEYPLMAKRGDLVIIQNGDNLIAGVVHLNGRDVISVSEDGPVRLPLADRNGKAHIVRSWSV
jgi:hypothetical protein